MFPMGHGPSCAYLRPRGPIPKGQYPWALMSHVCGLRAPHGAPMVSMEPLVYMVSMVSLFSVVSVVPMVHGVHGIHGTVTVQWIDQPNRSADSE